MDLTYVHSQDYPKVVTAKSVTGIGTLIVSECPGAQPMRLFLRPKSMVGLFRALRRAVLVDGSSNLLKLATLTIGTVGGDSQNINEDTDMSSNLNCKRNTPKSQHTPNITVLSKKRINESNEHKWEKELIDFLAPLPSHEIELMTSMLEIIMRRPSKRTNPCEIIKFVKEN